MIFSKRNCSDCSLDYAIRIGILKTTNGLLAIFVVKLVLLKEGLKDFLNEVQFPLPLVSFDQNFYDPPPFDSFF